MDMASDHSYGRVTEYTNHKEEKGWLVIGFIAGGLTSILQVCDLFSNRQFKAIIKKLDIKWRN